MSKNNILIVDDEIFNLTLLEFALEELDDVHIESASNAKDALAIVFEKQIDLIMLDISMPGMDGLEMLQQLKSHVDTKFIPVIMVTAKNEERYKALEYGSEDFLSKPIDVIEVKFKVQNLLKLKKFSDLQQHFNQRLEEEIAKKEVQLRKFAQVEQELLMAKSIQESLIPTSYTTSANLDVYGSCTQAHEVGGDYFDVFETEDGEHTVFIMADVSGHGFASALITMQFRAMVRAELSKGTRDFGLSIERINTIFANDNNESSMFITALFLRFNHKTKIIESANAGHYNPIGNIEMIHKSGIPMGIMPNITYEILKTPFVKGNTIFLYTDGLIEGEDLQGEMYEALFYQKYEQVKVLSSEEQVKILLEDYHSFIAKQTDDITLLVISF